MYIYLLYLSTDTNRDWIITSIFALIIFAIMGFYEKRIEDGKYINSIMTITAMITTFILINNINMLSLLPSINIFLYIILFSLLVRTLKSKNDDGKAKYLATITAIILIPISLLGSNYMGIESKPIRIADDYIVEKGYNLDEVDKKNIDYYIMGDDSINMAYIMYREDNISFEKIFTIKYYKGEIIKFEIKEY